MCQLRKLVMVLSLTFPVAQLHAQRRVHRRCSSQLMLLRLGVIVWLQLAVPLWAQPSVQPSIVEPPSGLSADQLLTFADQLLNEAEYFRAITEYRRFLFYYPDDARGAMALFRVGLAFYRGQSYGEALQTFHEVTQRYPATPYGRQAQLWQGESLMRQAQYGAAEQVYAKILEQSDHDDKTGQHAHYQRGWTFLYRRQWQEAAGEFQRVTSGSPLYTAAQRLAQGVLEGERLPRKSPVLAGLLSALLPGSGQLYNGRRGDALLAFLLNGLFLIGTLEAIDEGELAVAGILSFFEAGWYTGNVYGAVNGAQKHNRRVIETFLQNLENSFRLLPPEAHQSLKVGLRLSFGF